jgi:hypothetical protein
MYTGASCNEVERLTVDSHYRLELMKSKNFLNRLKEKKRMSFGVSYKIAGVT